MVRAGGCGVHSGQFLMCPEFALLLFAWGKGDREPRPMVARLFGEYGGRFTPAHLMQLHFCRDIYGLYQLPTCPPKKKKNGVERVFHHVH